MCICREPLALQESVFVESDAGCIDLQLHLHFYISCFKGNCSSCIFVNVSVSKSLSGSFFSCIRRVSASWRQPFCTFSSWHHSAGSSQRPGSPTWRWREKFGAGWSASASCVWAGVGNIISHCTSPLPFSFKVSGQGGQVTGRLFSSTTLILSVEQPDLHPISLFIVMVLCSSQALWGLGKWTGLEQWGGDRLVRLFYNRLQWPYVW